MIRRSWNKLLIWLADLSSNGDGSVKLSPQEELMIGSILLYLPPSFLWGVMYFYLGELSGLIPFSYSIFLVITLFLFIKKRKSVNLDPPNRFLALILPFILQLSLGGFINSSAVILWSFTSPIIALLTNKPKVAFRWFIAFILILIL